MPSAAAVCCEIVRLATLVAEGVVIQEGTPAPQINVLKIPGGAGVADALFASGMCTRAIRRNYGLRGPRTNDCALGNPG